MGFAVPYGLTLGCDPEFWFKDKEGNVIGSEKFIDPEKGYSSNPYGSWKSIVDGVQGEINVTADTCRQSLSGRIQSAFADLRTITQTAKGVELGATISISPLVKVSKKELATLGPKAQTFGCQPSLNIDKKMQFKVKSKNPQKYFFRSAGGHIHLGVAAWPKEYKDRLGEDYVKAIQMLDIIVGNTCVLLDRDEGNVERRKVYGLAGEYRVQPHGLEYRTLSPFWLRSYQTMSLVFALSRSAIGIVWSTYGKGERNLYEEIMAATDLKKVQKAINTNNKELAQENFDAIKQLLVDHYVEPFIGQHRLTQFEHFVEKGLDHWFSQDVVNNWLPRDRSLGWENFSIQNVQTSINNETRMVA